MAGEGVTTPGVIICGGRYSGHTFPVRAVLVCPTERVRRRFTGYDEPWYGIIWTCCRCGSSFDLEEGLRDWRHRDDMPGWRDKAAAEARETWKVAKALGSPEHRAWFKESMGW